MSVYILDVQPIWRGINDNGLDVGWGCTWMLIRSTASALCGPSVSPLESSQVVILYALRAVTPLPNFGNENDLAGTMTPTLPARPLAALVFVVRHHNRHSIEWFPCPMNLEGLTLQVVYRVLFQPICSILLWKQCTIMLLRQRETPLLLSSLSMPLHGVT